MARLCATLLRLGFQAWKLPYPGRYKGQHIWEGPLLALGPCTAKVSAKLYRPWLT